MPSQGQFSKRNYVDYHVNVDKKDLLVNENTNVEEQPIDVEKFTREGHSNVAAKEKEDSNVCLGKITFLDNPFFITPPLPCLLRFQEEKNDDAQFSKLLEHRLICKDFKRKRMMMLNSLNCYKFLSRYKLIYL